VKHRWAHDRDYCTACERSARDIVDFGHVECTPLTAVERAMKLQDRQRDLFDAWSGTGRPANFYAEPLRSLLGDER
jgi:hypothetical protein